MEGKKDERLTHVIEGRAGADFDPYPVYRYGRGWTGSKRQWRQFGERAEGRPDAKHAERAMIRRNVRFRPGADTGYRGRKCRKRSASMMC